MEVRIVSIGKTKSPYLREGIRDYLDRLRHYAKIEWLEVKEPVKSGKRTGEEIRRKEGDILLKALRRDERVILLDVRGRMLTTEAWVQWFRDAPHRGIHRVVFLIGGELGVSEAVRQRADEIWSLSRLTFTHDMTRLILLEQLYRVFTVLAGQKYHK